MIHASTISTQNRPDLLISAKGISVLHEGQKLLNKIDIEVSRQQIVTLIGLNGAGKSTLVKALLGLIKISEGSIYRKPGLHIGYTPQHIQRDETMPLTVKRFITLGVCFDNNHMNEVVDQVAIRHLLKRQIASLSGGELNRVMLARALSRKPDLLVLDEPMSSVDVSGQSELYDLISELRDLYQLGILLVSHDLHLVMAATDHVVCINQHVCCTGHPETVANHPEFVNLFGNDVASHLGLYKHHHDHIHDDEGNVIKIDTGDNSNG